MNNAHAARRRVSLLLSAAAPVALLLALAAPASAQIAAGGGSTAAGTVSNTYNGSGSATVFSGAASNTGGADTSTITLSGSRTLLNWNGFNLAPGDTLNFNQSGSTSIAVNRVLGGGGTIINGAVNSNGQVWFLDSSGVAVGGTAVLNVGGLLLSSLGLTDADIFDNDSSFNFTGVGGSVAVNGGAALNAAAGAVTVVGPEINFSGSATASGSIALIAARDATLVFDGDLDAYLALTVATGTDKNTAISVGSQARFDTASAAAGGRTYLIAAGYNGGLGSILLGGSAADAVEFVDGDVVLYAAGEESFSRHFIAGGALQTPTGAPAGDVTIGAATVSGGDLNVIASDEVIINDLISVPTGSVRLESGNLTTVSVSVEVGQNYTLKAPDWTGGAAFSPVFLNAASGIGKFIIQDMAFGVTLGGLSAPDELRITAENGGAVNVVGTLTAGNGLYLSGQSLQLGGDLTETGADGVLSLTSSDGISQTAGALTAGVLTISAINGVTLNGAANAIGALGASTANGLSLVDTGGLTVSGALNGGATGVSLTTTGDLTVQAPITASGITLSASGASSDIVLNAALDAGTSTVSLHAGGTISQSALGRITGNLMGGSGGATDLTAAVNRVRDLDVFTANGFSLVDEGGLTVTGGVNAGAGDILVRTTGGALSFSPSGIASGRDIVLSTDGDFINQSGSSALAASGKWTIYAASPNSSTFGGLDSGSTALWNGTLATRAPAGLSGNRYVFAAQPTLTVTTLSTSKVYGTDLTGSVGALYTVSGYHPGVAGAFLADTAATAFSGAAAISSTGSAERASVAGGPYAVTAAQGTLTSNSGYAFAFSNTGQITVTPKALTSALTASNKTYDGTTAGSGSVALSGVVSGDTVGTTAGTWTFADRNAGTGKTVTVSGVGLTGADAGNYTVTIPATALADILQRSLTVTLTASNKTYDGTTAGSGSVALSGVVSGDTVGTTAGTWTFADRNAATGKTVTVSGVGLTGADAGNYTVTIPATALADILQRAITANVSASNKTYDGTTAAAGTVTLNGVLGGDSVGATAGSFAFTDANAGTGKTVTVSGVGLTGADAGNYTLTVPASTLATILRRSITVSADAVSKTQGAPDPALTYAVTTGSLVTGDALTGALTRSPGEAPGAYAITQGSLAASANYQLTFIGNSLTITAVPVAPTTQTATVQEIQGLVAYLASYETPGSREGALSVVDERGDCNGDRGTSDCAIDPTR
ncbi:MAG: YDG domain-containing protein [Pseudomonadota bacterium]|nr:YDG domain-containing protein [Pseudomonadota bacterium]